MCLRCTLQLSQMNREHGGATVTRPPSTNAMSIARRRKTPRALVRSCLGNRRIYLSCCHLRITLGVSGRRSTRSKPGQISLSNVRLQLSRSVPICPTISSFYPIVSQYIHVENSPNSNDPIKSHEHTPFLLVKSTFHVLDGCSLEIQHKHGQSSFL